MDVAGMNYISSSTAKKVRLLGMSTACANATDLGNWLGVKEGLFNFKHSVRPVPLELYIDGFPDTRGFCPLMQSMNRPTFLAIKNHSPNKPVIVFVASRRQTRLTAKDLINFCGMEDNPRRFLRMDEEDLQLNLIRVKDDALAEALSFGIGLHHAGLVESDRQLSEELFLNDKIQILVATSTLAWGVNLPAHLVVVKGTQFYDAKIEGYKDMDLTDVLQMLGRAGRPQFDDSGVARIFTQDSKKDFYKHFLHTGFPVESSLNTVLDNHLCAEVSAETIVSKQDALDYLTWTFFFRRLHKNPSYYGLELSAEEHSTVAAQQLANEYMVDVVNKSLDELALSQCVEVLPNGDIDPTPFGRIMSYYYLSHKTIRHLIRHARAQASFLDVLSWMSCATEYDELPVRHNEDLINDTLSSNLPFSGQLFGLPMWDPHVKAFLLLQAHMSRIELPITDYVGDQTSVLDQAIRIIQASIDVLTELGYLSSTLQMIKLLQCIKCARWPKDAAVSILPGIEPDSTSDSTQLAAIGTYDSRQAHVLADRLGLRKGHPLRSQFSRAVSMLPNVAVSLSDVTALFVTVHLKRINILADRDARIFAPKFPKPQTEGWFVIIADVKRDEVIAVKRVNWSAATSGSSSQPTRQKSMSEATPSARTTIKLSVPRTGAQPRRIDILVVSDGYIGLEYRLVGVDVPAAPIVQNEVVGCKANPH